MGIAGQFIFNLVQEGIHGHGSQQLFGLLHRGQTNAGQPAVPDVVKAQEGEVFRDPDALFFRRLENAQGIRIRCGKDGRVPERLGKQLQSQLVAVLDGC